MHFIGPYILLAGVLSLPFIYFYFLFRKHDYQFEVRNDSVLVLNRRTGQVDVIGFEKTPDSSQKKSTHK